MFFRFKIDLIVWKFVWLRNIVQTGTVFKIDLIVWKFVLVDEAYDLNSTV